MKFDDALRFALQNIDSPEFIERIRLEDSTMLRHIPILRDINLYGFFTNESQAGRQTTGKDYIINERAYIQGFMTPSHAAVFLKEIGTRTDKIAVAVPICHVNQPTSMDIPLTVTVKKGVSTTNTHASSYLPRRIDLLYRKEARINKSEPVVFISVIDGRWNRNASLANGGLFTDVLKCLKH